MIGKYTKAATSFFSVLATGIIGIAALVTSIATNEQIAAVLPPSWAATIIAVGAGITALGGIVAGVATWLGRNQQTVDQVDEAIRKGDFSVNDVKGLIEKYGKHASLGSITE